MAAVIDFQTAVRVDEGQYVRRHLRAPAPNEDHPVVTRPHLVLVDGDPSGLRSGTSHPLDMRRVYFLRRLVAAAGVVVLLLLAVGVASAAIGSVQTSTLSETSLHVVTPDETLWSIAADARPGEDPRGTITEIVRANSTGSTEFDSSRPLQIGQEIFVPLAR